MNEKTTMKNSEGKGSAEHRKKLHQLFYPIFFEILFIMLAGMVDTLMLSTEGDQAVGAVGTANTYVSLFLIMFSVISSGMVAVMTQYIGAGRPGVAKQAMKIGLVFNAALGIAVTAVLVLGAEPILEAVGIARDLEAPAKIYLQVVGMFCLCNAITPIISSYLRSFGHTTPTLQATIVANALNVALNAVFLFVMDWGVFGVALATGISRLVNLVWVAVAANRRIKLEKDQDAPKNREIFGKIIRVGAPAAMETMLYNLAITLVISMLNRMDDTGMQATARAYALQITNFSYCVSAALAHANAVLVGWCLGAGEHDECVRITKKSTIIGISAGIVTAGIFAIFSQQIVGLFTTDPEMIKLVGALLVVNIFLEIGRSANLVYGFALKTSGDAVFPMVIAIIFMFLCAAGGTWLFGMKLGYLAVGAYVGMALDECIRGVLMRGRWQSGRWKRFSLVKTKSIEKSN
jgi:putative MATE family efflux protein